MSLLSHHALKETHKRLLAAGNGDEPGAPCRGYVRRALGMPCRHELARACGPAGPGRIPLDLFSQPSHLPGAPPVVLLPASDAIPRPGLLDPEQARTRGRPRGTTGRR